MNNLFYWLRRKYMLGTLITVVFLAIALQIVNTIDYRNSDFFTFWLSGHMVWTGQNPYDASDWISGHKQFGVTWIPNDRFVYPLPLSIFYAPLGLLSLYHAYILWIFLSEIMILLSVYMLMLPDTDLVSGWYIFPILAGVILFRPTWITLLDGQITAFLLFTLVCVIWLWGKDKWFLGGILLSSVGLKPNIGLPIIAIVSFWLFVQRNKTALAGILLSGTTLALIGMLLSANWIVEYWAIGNTKLSQTFGYAPTVWGLSSYITNFDLSKSLQLGWILTIIILFVVLLIVWKKHDVLSAAWIVGLSATFALLITPYSWPYDQILLLILIIAILMKMKELQYHYLLTTTAFILLDIVAISLLLLSGKVQMEIPNVAIPLVVFLFSLYFLKVPDGKNAVA